MHTTTTTTTTRTFATENAPMPPRVDDVITTAPTGRPFVRVLEFGIGWQRGRTSARTGPFRTESVQKVFVNTKTDVVSMI